jgi:hypothetical protein
MGRFEVATTPPPLIGVVLNDEGNNEDVGDCWKVVDGLLHGN